MPMSYVLTKRAIYQSNLTILTPDPPDLPGHEVFVVQLARLSSPVGPRYSNVAAKTKVEGRCA